MLAVVVGSLFRSLIPNVAILVIVAALGVFIVAGEFGIHDRLLPHRRAQVPRTVIDEGADAGALRFGFEMGTGMRTHMPSNLPYLPLALLILVATLPHALLAGVGFGLGRAWMALGRHYSPDRDAWDAAWTDNARLFRVALTAAATALAWAVLFT